MVILLIIMFFLIGFVLRDIINYLYNLYKKIRQADEILTEERQRREFKNKYDFSDSFKDDEKKNNN